MRIYHFHTSLFASIVGLVSTLSAMDLTPLKQGASWEYAGTYFRDRPYSRSQDKLMIRWDSLQIDSLGQRHYFTIRDSIWNRFESTSEDSSLGHAMPDSVIHEMEMAWMETSHGFAEANLIGAPTVYRERFPLGFLPNIRLDTAMDQKDWEKVHALPLVWKYLGEPHQSVAWYADSIGMIQSVMRIDDRFTCQGGDVVTYRILHLTHFKGQPIDLGVDSLFAEAQLGNPAVAKRSARACTEIYQVQGERGGHNGQNVPSPRLRSHPSFAFPLNLLGQRKFFFHSRSIP